MTDAGPRGRGFTDDGARRSGPWFDPRFAIGIALVVVSLVGVWWLVTASDRTVAVYAAGSTLTAGQAAGPAQLRTVQVRLGQSEDMYVRVGSLPEGGLVVTRTVGKGELLPVAAVGDATAVGVAAVVVTVTGALPQEIETGTVVDVWSAAPVQSGEYGPPTVLVSAVTVVAVTKEDGPLGSGDGVSVELSVPRSKVATVLAAIAAEHLVSLVPAEPGA